MSDSLHGAAQLNTPYFRWIVGLGIGLAFLHLVLAITWGQGQELAAMPWYAVVLDSITMVAAIAVAVLAFGRYQVSRVPTPFWEGVAFTAFTLFALFDSLTAPGTMPSGSGLLTDLPGTSSWFWHLMFSALGLFLICAVLLPWPRYGDIVDRWWVQLVVLGVAVMILGCWLILAFQSVLPPLIVDGAWTQLNRDWSIAILGVFTAGTVLSAHRLRRTDSLPLASLTTCLLLLTFAMVTDLAGTRLYDVWWYWRRILFAAAFLVMLFGLLLEYVQLYRREHDRTNELAALQRVASALMCEVELTRVADVIVDQCMRVLPIDAAEVWSAASIRRELDLLNS